MLLLIQGFEVLSKMNNRLVERLKDHIKNSPMTKFAILVIVVIILFAILGPIFAKDPNEIDVLNQEAPPSIEHPFGTDSLGRDYFSRALHGGRVSLIVGFSAVIISTIIGTLVGVISGYVGGPVDNIIMRFIDVLMSVPTFFLIAILSTYLNPGLQNVILILGLLGWMGLARMVRSQTLSLKTEDFVQYSKAIGTNRRFVIFRHLIRNILPIIIIYMTSNVGSAILTESALSFLGLGVSQPNASWGSMINDGRSVVLSNPRIIFIPGMLIFVTVLAFNILGESMRKAFDVKDQKGQGR